MKTKLMLSARRQKGLNAYKQYSFDRQLSNFGFHLTIYQLTYCNLAKLSDLLLLLGIGTWVEELDPTCAVG
jgi:hypothetical protein